MKHTLFIFLQIIVFGLASCKDKPNPDAEAQAHVVVDTTANLLHKITKLSRLYTTEYEYYKIVTQQDKPRLKGKLLHMPIDG